MKRFLAIALSLILVFSVCEVYAYTENPNKVKVSKKVYDIRKIPEKSFSPKAIKIDPSGEVTINASQGGSGYWWYAISVWDKTSQRATSASLSFTDSTKSTKKTIDYIAADTRLYRDGGLVGSGSDSHTNSSQAGARFDYDEFAGFSDYEVYGNHTFEQSGYQSWYAETYDT